VNLVTDSIRMLMDISRIKWLHRSSDFRAASRRFGMPALDSVKE
jgi:hypothetical protein